MRWTNRNGIALRADLRRTPRDFEFEAGLWDGPVLSEHLRKRYGIKLGVRQCQRLFRQMGFRRRKPRPQVAQSDPVSVAGERVGCLYEGSAMDAPVCHARSGF
ncbi:winged helix-turn-helix domain-containing protein [Paraburkholderia sediminicola]|uniref:winged helix-turn-helix domain-containing protein n=1 Tax=Paraburkholderia sediminicola TaxID=458836 RepID=UPI0038BCD7AD